MSEGSGGDTRPPGAKQVSPRSRRRQFMVLMWKHLLVRITKFIATPIELISPCFFFILIAVLKNILSIPDVQNIKTNLVSVEEDIRYTDISSIMRFRQPSLILYSPVSKQTDNLMQEVGTKLGTKRLEALPSLPRYEYGRTLGYIGFSGDTLPTILNQTKHAAVVIFEDMGGETLPQKLRYTIRIQEDFQTHTYQTDGGSSWNLAARYRPFLLLQWAIDTGYISLLSEHNISQKLYFQEFPSSAWTDTIPGLYKYIVTIVRVICGVSLLMPFVFLLTRLMEERATGVQELIRMVGVSKFLLALSHFANVAATGLCYSIFGTIVIKVFLPNCGGFLIFLMLVFHFTSIMALAFVCSYVNKTGQHATILALLSYILLISFNEGLILITIKPVVHLTLLLPHVPLAWFWKEVEVLGGNGRELDASTMFQAHNSLGVSAALALFMLIFQTAFYMLV
ncbi:hypothetical protein O0L34_g7482 [Tuta absoluta]|nr:hypothetical protein O0L34_g7482 [Tuta absoluta]